MSYDLDLYRSWFPHHHTGKIWLNHAAVSPLSHRVTQAVNTYLQERSVQKIDTFFDSVRAAKEAKQNLAALINGDPDRIAFVGNTSDGLNILASGLEWNPGDRIILNDIEFPSNIYPFLNLQRFGVEIDYVKSVNGMILIEDIQRAITPRTRLLSISFVQFLSGYKVDLAALGAVCKEHNILFSVDAIQGLGVAPLDVRSAQIDFLSCGGPKWLMGMLGLGFIYLTQKLQETIQQRSMGWTSNRDFFGDFFNYRIDLDTTARRYENGTINFCAVTALEASTRTLLDVGIENIQQHVFTLTDRVFAFCEEERIPVITPRDRNHRAGIVTIRLPNADTVFRSLLEQNIVISLREGLLRISPHFYNSLEDIQVLCTMLFSLMDEPE